MTPTRFFLETKTEELSKHFFELAKKKKPDGIFESAESAAISKLAMIYAQLIIENYTMYFQPKTSSLREIKPDGFYKTDLIYESDDIKTRFCDDIKEYVDTQFNKVIGALPADEKNDALKEEIKEYLDDFMAKFKNEFLACKNNLDSDPKLS